MDSGNDFRNTLYTIDKSGARRWVYARYVPGIFFRYRRIVAYALLVFYLSMPWITIGGKQGILLDLEARRFTFFGLELWATDTIFLFLALGLLGMSLFFFTSILGRVWCGWACPETVFLEFVFRPIERLIEGQDSERRKLDAAPWGMKKIIKKGSKHLLCAIISWFIASTALAYFVGKEPLIEMMSNSPLQNPYYFCLTLALMGVMAFQFGWFREQFCTILCPYARFQSVLMDENSLLVGYDYKRGEPRGKVRSKTGSSGDCIDCKLCVKVCPTGIDIRNGTQLECVACTACIDACNSIMDQIGKPRWLIRYDTEAGLSGKVKKWIRPRIFVYSLLIVLLFSTLVYSLANRNLQDIEIVREIHVSPYSADDSGIITNQFSLRISNKGSDVLTVRLKDRQPASLEVISPLDNISIGSGQSVNVPIFIRSNIDEFSKGNLPAELSFITNRGAIITKTFNLLGPIQ